MVEVLRRGYPDASVEKPSRNLSGYIALVREVYELYSDQDLLKRATNAIHTVNGSARRQGRQFRLHEFAVTLPDPILEDVVLQWQKKNPGEERELLRANLDEIAHDAKRSEAFAGAIDDAIDTLRPRFRAVIRWRFQLDHDDQPTSLRTLESIGGELDVTKERSRQLVAKAKRELKQAFKTDVKPFIRPYVKGFVEDGVPDEDEPRNISGYIALVKFAYDTGENKEELALAQQLTRIGEDELSAGLLGDLVDGVIVRLTDEQADLMERCFQLKNPGEGQYNKRDLHRLILLRRKLRRLMDLEITGISYSTNQIVNSLGLSKEQSVSVL